MRGGGTEDTVKTELEALKSSMAQLQTKSEQLESKIDQLINSGGGISSCIRRIQRGVTTVYKTEGRDISLSEFTDFNKMIAIVDSSATIKEFTKSELSLRQSPTISSGSISVYYQVIEFY